DRFPRAVFLGRLDRGNLPPDVSQCARKVALTQIEAAAELDQVACKLVSRLPPVVMCSRLRVLEQRRLEGIPAGAIHAVFPTSPHCLPPGISRANHTARCFCAVSRSEAA